MNQHVSISVIYTGLTGWVTLLVRLVMSEIRGPVMAAPPEIQLHHLWIEFERF